MAPPTPHFHDNLPECLLRTKPPANYTTPDKPRFIDIFKGRDDEDFIRKTRIMCKFTGWYTFSASLVDIILFTDPSTLVGGLSRVMYWGVPIIGGGLAYTATMTTMASLRKKDDQWNHFFAGGAYGSVCGAARKSIPFGIMMGLGLGLVGALMKDSVIYKYQVWPEFDIHTRQIGHAWTHKTDYSTWLTPDTKGWWARSEEEAKKRMEEDDFDVNGGYRIAT